MRRQRFFLLVAGALTATAILAACTTTSPPGGDGAEPTAEEVSTFELPTKLFELPEGATVEIPPTPAPLTPAPAAEVGRSDCPEDWAAYEDPEGDYSICYPADWRAMAGPEPLFRSIFMLWSPDTSPESDGVYLRLHWRDTAIGCAEEGLWTDVQDVIMTLAGKDVSACGGDVPDFEAPDPQPVLHRGTSAEIPLGSGEGYVDFLLIERKDISEAQANLLQSILQSLQVGQ